MTFYPSSLPSFPTSIPVVGVTNPTTTPMSFQSINAEAEAIGAHINAIIQRIRTATIDELHHVEEAVGLIHPEVNTFNDFDNRLGTIVERLHHVEPAQLDQVRDLLGIGGAEEVAAHAEPLNPDTGISDAAAEGLPVPEPVNGAIEAPTPDQAVS
jgi:hypothetical protein